MSELDGKQTTTLKRPYNDDKEAWKAYWEAQGQDWRTEPEIDVKRQQYLAKRREIKPDIKLRFINVKEAKIEAASIHFERANLSQAQFDGAILLQAHFERTDLSQAHFDSANLIAAHFERADLTAAHFDGAKLKAAHFERADLTAAHFERTDLSQAHFERAHLGSAQFDGAYFSKAYFDGADLRRAFFDSTTSLEDIQLSSNTHGTASFADIHWGDVNVAVVDWSKISILGDEIEAKRKKSIYDYEKAARAYRQLSVVLRNQGINEHAARFNYRAQLMQRELFKFQDKRGQYLFSLFLDLLSGYGYKPARCFIAYLIVILSFAITYLIIGQKVGPVLSPLGSLVFSMTSFHGRGFFPGGIALDDPLTVVAALEAFIGLLIEVTFIATLTQRLFGR